LIGRNFLEVFEFQREVSNVLAVPPLVGAKDFFLQPLHRLLLPPDLFSKVFGFTDQTTHGFMVPRTGNPPILDFVEKGLLDSRFFLTSGRLDEFT
jgi:hypothetical protein